MERIAKYISSCGFCSRRNAEKLILEGRVKVDGNTINTPATLVDENSLVEIDGNKISKIENKKIWVFNKPKGYICSQRDEKNRPIIYDLLPSEFKNLHYIGRLDINSEGLLLLTNSGEVKRYYEHPQNKIERVYLVRVFGKIPPKMFDICKKGIAIKDDKTSEKILYTALIEPYKENSEGGKNTWLKFTLKEGKNREIRKICEFFNLSVSKLKRISFGEFKLLNLNPGEFREV